MENEQWIVCPNCNNKTRRKERPDTVFENFLLFCPKRKRKTIVKVKQYLSKAF